MKKRIISAFSLVCSLALLMDFSLDERHARLYETSYDSIDSSTTAGVIATATVDLQSIEDANVSRSSNVITAASLGALYGYKNIGICIVESGNLNVRAEASTDGKLIGKFPRDAACEVISTEGEWSYIQSGEIEGYVNNEFLLTGDDAWELATELAQYVATSTTGGLNIRTEPNTECEVLAQLADGEEVTVLEEGDEWTKVDIDGEEGYVFNEYIEIDLSLNTAMTLAQARYGSEVSEARVGLCDYALQFVGNRYVWGGTSLTNGVDCSGFVMQVYKKYGVSLPHSSRAQANSGTKISYSQLQPGDLIFYAKGSTINHVAIYIGGGQIVHASNPRTGIKVSNATYRTPVKCVRIFSE